MIREFLDQTLKNLLGLGALLQPFMEHLGGLEIRFGHQRTLGIGFDQTVVGANGFLVLPGLIQPAADLEQDGRRHLEGLVHGGTIKINLTGFRFAGGFDQRLQQQLALVGHFVSTAGRFQ